MRPRRARPSRCPPGFARQRLAPHAPPPPLPIPGPVRSPLAPGGGLGHAPVRSFFGGALCCRPCNARRPVEVTARTRATSATDVGARRSTGGRHPRGPLGCARGSMRPRCTAAAPPPPCVGAGPGVARARGTQLPRSTTCTCWCPPVRRVTPCHTPRKGGNCVGGGRPVTTGRGGGARDRPIVGGGGLGAIAGRRRRGLCSVC